VTEALSSRAQLAIVARSPGMATIAAGVGSQTAIVRYASTAGRARPTGTPKAINTPAIPPLTVPGSGTVLAICPTR
jgi:hypothetical protein